MEAATVDSSVGTLQSTNYSLGSNTIFKCNTATLGSDGVTLDSVDATLGSPITLQSNAATLGSPITLQSNAATLGSPITLQSNAATLGSPITLQSNTATLGSDSVTLDSVDATLGSPITLQSNGATMGSDSVTLDSVDATLGSPITLQSNTATLGSDSVTLDSVDATLGSPITLQSNAATLGYDDMSLGSNNAASGSDSIILESVDATSPSRSTIVISAGACKIVEASNVQVSVIIPVYNAAKWLDECLQTLSDQDFRGTLEISVYDDGSTDNSREIAESWREKLGKRGVSMVISGHNTDKPRGVGYAKNKAVAQSSGQYLCFQDADDVMLPQRVRLQYEAAVLNPNTVVGCQVKRIPEGSTERYTRWINTLRPKQLLTQVFTSHGPTVVMPTWFCSRSWFQKVGPFDEGGMGVPEDLLWFYQSLRQGGGAIRVDKCLLIYRYHKHAATHSILEETIWNLRVNFLEERVLRRWGSFTIWNAGKQGRKLYRSLTSTNQKKVEAFCDVDENKIKKGFYTYEESKEGPKPRIPVLHYRDASPPFIVCVKLDMTGGVLEDTLLSLRLTEGHDYYHFS